MYDKYILLKKLYPNYLILIKRKSDLMTFNNDKILYKYNKTLQIDHIIVDNLDIMIKNNYHTNYESIYFKFLLIDFFARKRKELFL